jgi:peptide/nickel transport system substrate-binding protein
LRQAVALSLDKQKMVEVAFGGIGEVSSVMPPLFHACDVNSLQFYKRDIKKAKALLKESGIGPIKFRFAIGPTTAYSVLAQLVKDNVAEIGLDAEISVSDEASWIKKIWVDNPSPTDASIFWFAGYSDPAMVPLWFNPKLAGFTGGYVPEEPELNAVIDKARSLGQDDPTRPKALQNLCAAIDEDATQIPLVTRIDTVAFRKAKFAKFNTAHLDGYGNTLFGVKQAELAS